MTSEILRDASDLKPGHSEISPIWEYALDREQEGDLIRPVFNFPVDDLGNRFAVTSVHLANGQSLPAIVANVSTNDPYKTRHFISLAVWHANDWFDLARYHDADIGRNGPPALALHLGLPVDAAFPITYDLRPYCIGDPKALAGMIEAEPQERLSDEQLVKLARSD